MLKKKVTVENKLGLHARPSALLVKTSSKFRSEIHIQKETMVINAKSIMGVMMLAAEYKSELEIVVNGVDEVYLMEEIEKLFVTRFGED